MTTQRPETPQSLFVKHDSTAATPALELLHFLELSIGEKTDAYLQELALRTALAESIAKTTLQPQAYLEKQEPLGIEQVAVPEKEIQLTTKKENAPITGIITISSSILYPIDRHVNAKFSIIFNVISQITADTVLFLLPRGGIRSTFTLSYSNVEQAFNISPSILHPQQEFDAVVLSANFKTIQLRLTEKHAIN